MHQLLLALVLAFDAGSNAPPPPHHGHHAPPQEAIDACTKKKADDACSFTFRDHAITGTCKAPPDNASQLACRPDHPPPHHGGSDEPPPPPPEGAAGP
jgi:hypothetical protein